MRVSRRKLGFYERLGTPLESTIYQLIPSDEFISADGLADKVLAYYEQNPGEAVGLISRKIVLQTITSLAERKVLNRL